MNHKLLMNFALLTGEIMMENGAETFRVEDTITRILNTSNCQTVEAFVTPTGIFATLDHIDIDLLSYVKRIKKRSINLNRISKANHISRDFCAGKISLESAMYQMNQVKEEPAYPSKAKIAATGLSAGFFALMFGGSPFDMAVSLICGILIGYTDVYMSNWGISKFFIQILGGMISAFIPYIMLHLFHFGSSYDLIVISSIMPMVPGVAITNGIRDTLHGELLSGLARIMDAFIIAASIATGVGIVVSILY